MKIYMACPITQGGHKKLHCHFLKFLEHIQRNLPTNFFLNFELLFTILKHRNIISFHWLPGTYFVFCILSY